MLRWSMNLFRVCGIQLSVHASFFPLLAYVAWEGWRIAQWKGAAWSVAHIVSLFICVVLHEFGHAAAARYFGIKVPRITLLPIGGMAEMESIPRQPKKEIIIALAGPAVNYVLIALLMIFVRFPTNWMPEYVPTDLPELFRHIVAVNVVMGVFNLIPVFPMDGGRVFRALAAIRLPYVEATAIAARLACVLGLVGIGTMLIWPDEPHYLGAVLFAFIILSGQREWRAVRQNESALEVHREWAAKVANHNARLAAEIATGDGESGVGNCDR